MIPIYIFLLGCVGFFCVGALCGCRRAELWRIEWIMLEHNLARLEKRSTRTTDSIEDAW